MFESFHSTRGTCKVSGMYLANAAQALMLLSWSNRSTPKFKCDRTCRARRWLQGNRQVILFGMSPTPIENDRDQFRERICAHTSMTFDYRTVTLYPSILTFAIRTKPNYEWCHIRSQTIPRNESPGEVWPLQWTSFRVFSAHKRWRQDWQSWPQSPNASNGENGASNIGSWETTWPRPMAHERVPKGKNVLNLM